MMIYPIPASSLVVTKIDPQKMVPVRFSTLKRSVDWVQTHEVTTWRTWLLYLICVATFAKETVDPSCIADTWVKFTSGIN